MMNITYNANSGFGLLMIMIGLVIVVGIIERCPVLAVSNNPCDQKIVVKIIPEKETFEIGEEVKLINNSKSIKGWKWSLGGSDSITDGGINQRVVKFIYRRDGEKKIRLVNKYIKCRKIVHTLNVNEEEKTKKRRPKPHKSCPTAKIRKVGGKLHCYTNVQFDAGLSGNDDLVWSFDELKTITATGNRVWHKFIDETTYPVRVYCKGREIARQDVYVTCF